MTGHDHTTDLDPQWIETAAERYYENLRAAQPYLNKPPWTRLAGREKAGYLGEARAYLAVGAPLIAERAAAAEREHIAPVLHAARVYRTAAYDQISGGTYHQACGALRDAIAVHDGIDLGREPRTPPTDEEMERGRELVRQAKAYTAALEARREAAATARRTEND